MKHQIILLLGILFLAGCHDSSELYDYPTNKIGFLLEGNVNKDITKTFIYDHSSIERDTIYLEMRTMGFVTSYDRRVLLEQADALLEAGNGIANAVPGVHYVPFDSPEYDQFSVVPAGSAIARIPVILLRAPSLAHERVALRVRIVDTEEFVAVNPEASVKNIFFSDMLEKPEKWDSSFEKSFGKWGVVKYRFMLDNSSELWDDAFIDVLMNDFPYLLFWQTRLNNLLDEENARREANGEGPLREAPEAGAIEGILVRFP